MGKSLALIGTVLAVLTGIAWLWQPKKDYQGKTPLVWVSDNNPTRSSQIDAFNLENPTLHLELDYGNANMQKIIMQCCSGVGPDLFDYSNQQQQTYAEAGLLWDVSEAAERMVFSASTNGWPSAKDAALCSGRQYGFFANVGVQILIYNKNVFDYFGVAYPKESMTWEEFQELAGKVNSLQSEDHMESRIFALTGAGWSVYFESLRGEFFTEDGLLDIRSGKMVKAFQWHREMLFKYKLMPTSIAFRTMSGQGGWGTGTLNSFASGHSAMLVGGEYALIAFQQGYENQLKNGKTTGSGGRISPFDRPLRIGATALPHPNGSLPSYRVLARMTGINPQSPHREEALKLLQFMAGPQYSACTNQGLDWLPGDPQFADLGLQEEYPDLSRYQMRDVTKKAMTYGYVQRLSPFLLLSDVNRVLESQINRMESDPDLPVHDLLAAAESELLVLLHRNLDRHPDLKRLYEERAGRAKGEN